ncbi:MAG: alpha/beta fold hydrolase, partial [Gaiellaceae bacterium]
PLGGPVTWLAKRSATIAASDMAPVLGRVIRGGFADPSKMSREYIKLLARVGREEKGFGKAQRAVLRASGTWAATSTQEYPKVPADLRVELIYGDRDWASAPHREHNVERLAPVGSARVLANTGHFAFQENPRGILETLRPLVTE